MGVGGSHPALRMFCPKVTPSSFFVRMAKLGSVINSTRSTGWSHAEGGLMPAKTEYGGGTTPLPFGKKSGVWGVARVGGGLR